MFYYIHNIYLAPSTTPEQVEYYVECEYANSEVQAQLASMENWLEFEGLSGQPWTIALHGSASQLVLRLKYTTSRQRAQVKHI